MGQPLIESFQYAYIAQNNGFPQALILARTNLPGEAARH